MWLFYLQRNLAAVDTVLSLMLYVGCVDGYGCWKEGVPGRGVFRFCAGVVVGGWGMLGITSRGGRASRGRDESGERKAVEVLSKAE